MQERILARQVARDLTLEEVAEVAGANSSSSGSISTGTSGSTVTINGVTYTFPSSGGTSTGTARSSASYVNGVYTSDQSADA